MNAQDGNSIEETSQRLKRVAFVATEPVREVIARILSILLGSFLLMIGTGGLVLTVTSYFFLSGVQAGIFGTIGLYFMIFPYSIYGLLWLNRYKF